MKTPRQIAAEMLMQVEQRKAWSNLMLDSQLEKYKLDSRDSAFVGALFYGVLERRITLDACLAVHVRQPIEKLSLAVLAALRLGVYQLLYMDSVPERAAVSESVEVVKHLRKAQAAGFVNGVLRSFLRAGKQVPIPAEPAAAALAVQYSCPQPLVELWLQGYGEICTRRILADSLGRPPIYLRVNTLLLTPEDLQLRLAAHGIEAVPASELAGCLMIQNAGALHTLPEYRQGLFHVQDKSSQLCALALDARPGMRVLDACAAPGGKSFTLFQLMQGQGELLAADLYEHRTHLTEKRAKEMQLTGIRAIAADMSVYDASLGLFDRVLCDVPCSGLGVIRRKPEIKYKDLAEFEELPNEQYKILETAAQYCKEGALLLYSTCTLNPAENRAVAGRFLQCHPEFTPYRLPAVLGGEYERTLAGELNADGFYMALFQKGGAR